MPIDGELQTFFAKRNTEGIKTALAELPPSRKGCVFENVLAELYRGNGWIVTVEGGRGDDGADILLSHPKTPHTVSLIVQTKNHNKPLTLDQTRSELIKFEQQAAPRYKCQQFRLVSVNGFVGAAEKLRAFNLLLDSWEHVEKLMQHYNPKKNVLPNVELFSHNQQTYNELQKLWRENNHVAVVQATGTGKSFLIAKVMSDFHGKHKIVLAPSHYILDQQKSKAPWLNDKTIYWTYAGLVRKSVKDIKALNTSLIVLDEFHRCGADEWGKGVQKLLDTHTNAKVLGTSATPIRYLDESRDMTEELFDGVVAADISLAEAIVIRILPTPTYISTLYSLEEEIKTLLEDVDLSKRTDDEKKNIREEIKVVQLDWEKTSGVPEILKRYLPKDINKLIVFCKDQEHLDQMEVEVQKWFQKAGTHKFREKYRILSADPQSKKSLRRFIEADNKDTVHLLFAIDMLNEGLHIPKVDAVILLRPTESPTIFYQQIGRCIEVGKGRSPIIIDLVNNFQNVRAMDFLNDLKEATVEESKRRTELGLSSYTPSMHVQELTLNIEEVFDSIRERLVSWEIQYEALCSFKEKHGHCNVPNKYPDNASLGKWVGNQRTAGKNNKILSTRMQRLEAIGFVWDIDAVAWEKMFENLRTFKEKHGHSNVPEGYSDNPSLAIWVSHQRSTWKSNALSKEHIRSLAELGFVWKPHLTAWEKMLETLRSYNEKHGHCNVPNRFSDNPALGHWCQIQRQARKNGKLSNERIRRLEELEFIWDSITAAWDEMFKDLCAFKDKFRHCNVPQRYPDNPSLGGWVGTQRRDWSKGRLQKDRIRRLEELGFVMDPISAAWDEMHEALCGFNKIYGHCNVPQDYTDNPILGPWVNRQRLARRKGNLPKDRIQRLDALGFAWDPLPAVWEEMFEALCAFKQKNGHCNVSQRYTDNPSLGMWAWSQRKAWKKGKMSQSVPGVWRSWDLFGIPLLAGNTCSRRSAILKKCTDIVTYHIDTLTIPILEVGSADKDELCGRVSYQWNESDD